jgi:long-chain alkane monooxygenase
VATPPVVMQMRFNAFSMNCVGHQAQGLWRHPRDRSMEYTSIGYWVELARTLERGCFDALFLADVLGVYDVYDGGPDAALRNAVQVPANDPMLVVPVMAAVTEDLGFGVTGITSFEPPYTFARRISTLDHLTGGRISWNIVTGYLDSAARAMGDVRQTAHDTRYDMAEEYLEVVYRLWEGSWEDDAVVRDRATGMYADPAKVHRITHDGRYYRLDGIHLAEPSPQRTPVLFQAGSSRPGQRFAARHAECVFVAGNDQAATASTVSQLREDIATAGRDPAGVLVYSMISIVVDETAPAARRKVEEYASYASAEGALALLSGWSGHDYARPFDERDASDAIAAAANSRPRDVEAAARHVALAGSCPLVVGSPTDVADELEARMAATGVDGFNITRQVVPESFLDVVDMVVPELQRRGVYQRAYAPGTLREKLTGGTARLVAPHPAARHRPPPPPPERSS